MPDTPTILVKKLQKTFIMGDVTLNAVKEVDFQVMEGEFVAIMGPSGSGKSTMMNILGCLDNATSGEYFIDGVNVNEKTPNELAELRNQKIGFIFQSYNLLARTSAIENVELPMLYNSKISSDERNKRALAALKSVGLESRAKSMPNQLSGGQQQRVAIARALVTDPVLILADEPTGNLDTRTSFEIMSIFQKMNAQGKTIVLVTHEQDIASFTKRQVTFRDGKIFSDEINKDPLDANKELEKLPKQEEIPA